MQARIVATARGAGWLAEGWRLFRGAPIGWLAAVFGYWLLMTIVSLVPFVGVPAAALLVPAFSVGFMALARAVERSGTLELALLLEGFRGARRAQLGLGVVYLAGLASALGASALVDQGALATWMLAGRSPSAEMLDSDAFVGALALAMALYLPVMLAFWFAPPLAAWQAAGVGKALFFSFFACLMNWRAFLAYGALTALAAAASAVAMRLSALFFLPVLIILLPTLFASFYASYDDVFGERGLTAK
jgi:hypothetical protein